MKIGFFDSGIGGLSVMHRALKVLPDADYIFYADREHVPYGEKKKEQIVKYVDDAVAFMIGKGTDAIVIACNTATSAAIDVIRSKYDIPIIGMEPAVKKAVEESGAMPDRKRILVVATPVTVRGEKLRQLIEQVDDHHLVELLPLPELVSCAERGEFAADKVLNLLQEKFCGLNLEEYSTLVLGCTHFNYFKDTFRMLLPPDVKIMDGNEGTINRLRQKISGIGTANPEKNIEYFFSGKAATNQDLLRMCENLERLEQMYVIG